jgi:putative ABC transport system permease protein
MYSDHKYAELLDLKITKGRFFSPEIASDKTNAVIINEAAARKLGLSNPLGKRFRKEYDGAEEGEYVTIIGVLDDFHFFSLHHQILPMIIRNLGNSGRGFYLSLKIQSKDLKGTIARIEKKWKAETNGQPFQYSFLDDDFNSLYKKEVKLTQIMGMFFILSIMVAGLGLFGLTSFLVEKRKKEIGIRKVLGSSSLGVFNILISHFITLVLIANIIAWPVAYYLMTRWLQNYAYHITIGLGIFIASLFVTFIITLLTVSTQTFKLSRANPVDSLRYE